MLCGVKTVARKKINRWPPKKEVNKRRASFGNQPKAMDDELSRANATIELLQAELTGMKELQKKNMLLDVEVELLRGTKRARTESCNTVETENNALLAKNAALVKENDVLETDNRNIVIQNKLLTADLLAANIKIGDLMPEATKVPGLEKELKEALRSAGEYKTSSYTSSLKINELKAKLEAKK